MMSRWWCRKRWCEYCKEHHRMGSWSLEMHQGALAHERRLAALAERQKLVEQMIQRAKEGT